MTEVVDEPPPLLRTNSFRDSYHSPNRERFWPDVSYDNWNNWKWQQTQAVISVRRKGARLGLEDIFPLDGAERERLLLLEETTNTRIPPYVIATMGDIQNPLDPISIQVVPSSREIDERSQTGMLADPLSEDEDSPVPHLTHRYPDRALLTVTSFCQLYCRFCTRSRKTLDQDGQEPTISDESFRNVVDYIQKNPQLREIITSGGDPLMLPTEKLRTILTGLSEIPHLTKVRIGSRVPVTLPQRLFDKDVLDVLGEVNRKYDKLWLHTHFNHPYEFTAESAQAVRNVRKLEINVLNHSVLLEGVNNDYGTMKELLNGLERMKITPYYLFHCDPVTGGGHFRTSLEEGMALMNSLRGNISGAKFPDYVVDLPYGGGKVVADSLKRVASGREGGEEFYVFANFEGGLVKYHPQRVPERKGEIELLEVRSYEDREHGHYISKDDVVAFIRSGRDYSFPENSERMQRRREKYGVLQSLPVLSDAA